MFYVYILYSLKDNKFYNGFTTDLRKRVKEHQGKKVLSTKGRIPLNLVYYEAYLSEKDALKREKYFKTDKGKKSLKLMLKNYLESLKTGGIGQN